MGRFTGWIVAFVVTFLAAPATRAVEHVCHARVSDGYGRPWAHATVQLTVFEQPDPGGPGSSFSVSGVTGSSGQVDLSLDAADVPSSVSCELVPASVPNRVRNDSVSDSWAPGSTSGVELALNAQVAPSPDDLERFPGLQSTAPQHGRATAYLYLGNDASYDKVVIIPESLDFAEQVSGQERDRDRFWLELDRILVPLYDAGYDVWLFEPYKTGENLHEQAAELAQAIAFAASYEGGPAAGGKLIAMGASLGGLVVRLATARWEADPAWRQSLERPGFPVPATLPVAMLGFADAALRGANVSIELQKLLLSQGAAAQFNLDSCAAQQLLRQACQSPSSCSGANWTAFFQQGGEVSFPGGGVCDRQAGGTCVCDAGPAVSSVNGDGFAHAPYRLAYAASTWNPGFNQCYGDERDRNADGADLCRFDPGGSGPFVPQVGNHYVSFLFNCTGNSGNIHLQATADDLQAGSRFPFEFARLGPAIPGPCGQVEVKQNFAFTFIPIKSALSADGPGGVPFPADDVRTLDYQAIHDNPPESLINWLFQSFVAVYGDDPPGGGGGGGQDVPPAAPSDVLAVPVPGGGDQVVVTWRDRSYNENGFKIYRLRGGDTHPVEAGEVEANEKRFRDTVPILPGPDKTTEYYFYKVVAYNDAGHSPDSNRDEARMYNLPPGKPDTLRPRGCISTFDPLLSWRGGGYSSSFYLHMVNAATGQEWDWYSNTNSSPSPTVLTAHTPYMLKVIGQNNVGHGATSEPEFFVPLCNPTEAPILAAPAAGCIGTTTPEIRWSAVPGALGYHLRIHRVDAAESEVCTGGIGTAASETSWQVPVAAANCPLLPLQPGQEYRVKVKAFTGVDGPYSTLRFFIPHCAPSSLGTASPISPAGGTVPSQHPIYSWEPAAQAQSYTIKVVTDTVPQVLAGQATFAATVCVAGVCTARPSFALADGPYRWWVEAGSGALHTVGPYAKMTVAPQAAALSVANVTAAEGGGAARFTLTVEPPAGLPIDLHYATADGSARAPADYAAVSGWLRIPAGHSVAFLDVPVASDAVYEGSETFSLSLANALGATIADGVGEATITDDDAVPSLQLAGAAVAEPDSGQVTASFTVSLAGATEVPVTVSWATAGCTASAGVDYATAAGTLTFSPGGPASATVGVPVYGDLTAEADETFLVNLSNPLNAVLDQGAASGIIRDDDRTWSVPPRADFNADGKSDLLWRNDASGNFVAWFMDGLARLSGAVLDPPQPASPGWAAVAENDFDGDGHTDLLWANQTSGNLSLWLMNGTVRSSGTAITGIADLAWQVAASADFNGDTKPDLLWRNRTTGELKAWYMDGAVKLGEANLVPAALTDLNWLIAAVGDLDADGKADLLWRHALSGALVVWWMDGVARLGGGYLTPSSLDSLWQAVGIWDVDFDGRNDLVWQHRVSKRVVVWLMNGAVRICGSYLEPAAPATPAYTAVGPR